MCLGCMEEEEEDEDCSPSLSHRDPSISLSLTNKHNLYQMEACAPGQRVWLLKSALITSAPSASAAPPAAGLSWEPDVSPAKILCHCVELTTRLCFFVSTDSVFLFFCFCFFVALLFFPNRIVPLSDWRCGSHAAGRSVDAPRPPGSVQRGLWQHPGDEQ